MNKLFNSIRSFAIEEDGAQVVEYALIIAVVSIALVIALRALTQRQLLRRSSPASTPA